MKPTKFCLVNAFADSAFKGNPAAVCLLEEEEDDDDHNRRDDHWLQAVAREFNQPVTCYLKRLSHRTSDSVPRFSIRWFTPLLETEICGHATLAASHFHFTHDELAQSSDAVEFSSSMFGILTARRKPAKTKTHHQSNHAQFMIELDFPILSPTTELDGRPIKASSASKCFITAGTSPVTVTEILASPAHDFLFVLPSGEAVAEAVPDYDEIRKYPGRGVMITGVAPVGSGYDFISRLFAPKTGVYEDQVCVSGHCAVAPYWSKKLGKCDLIAYQASERGGVLDLHVDEKIGRMLIKGKAIIVMEGSLLV